MRFIPESQKRRNRENSLIFPGQKWKIFFCPKELIKGQGFGIIRNDGTFY
jgi:hypothetical protein